MQETWVYLGLIPGSGRSPGEEDGSSLQYSCLENPMDKGDNPWKYVELFMTKQVVLSRSLSEPSFYFEPEFTKRDILKER